MELLKLVSTFPLVTQICLSAVAVIGLVVTATIVHIALDVSVRLFRGRPCRDDKAAREAKENGNA